MEGLAEVDDLVAELPDVPLPEVLADLPVEGDLEGVLHGQGPALDEEQVVEVLGQGQPAEGVHELGHLHGVEVRVGDLVEGGALQLGQELRLEHLGVVHAQRRRGEVGEEIHVLAVLPGIVDVGALALFEVHDQVESVRQHILPDDLVHEIGGDFRRLHRRHDVLLVSN